VSHLAEKVVTRRSNGEKVRLELLAVNRQLSRVTISIPDYNSVFTFQPGPGFAVLAEDGRMVIDPAEKATDHVSGTVYREMAKWAWAILTAKREVA